MWVPKWKESFYWAGEISCFRLFLLRGGRGEKGPGKRNVTSIGTVWARLIIGVGISNSGRVKAKHTSSRSLGPVQGLKKRKGGKFNSLAIRGARGKDISYEKRIGSIMGCFSEGGVEKICVDLAHSCRGRAHEEGQCVFSKKNAGATFSSVRCKHPPQIGYSLTPKKPDALSPPLAANAGSSGRKDVQFT